VEYPWLIMHALKLARWFCAVLCWSGMPSVRCVKRALYNSLHPRFCNFHLCVKSGMPIVHCGLKNSTTPWLCSYITLVWKILLCLRENLIVVNTLYSNKLMGKSNWVYLQPCKLTTIRFPHTAMIAYTTIHSCLWTSR